MKHTSSQVPLPDALYMGRPGAVRKLTASEPYTLLWLKEVEIRLDAAEGRKPSVAARWELGHGVAGLRLPEHRLTLVYACSHSGSLLPRWEDLGVLTLNRLLNSLNRVHCSALRLRGRAEVEGEAEEGGIVLLK